MGEELSKFEIELVGSLWEGGDNGWCDEEAVGVMVVIKGC